VSVEFYVFADSRETVGEGGPVHGIRPGTADDLLAYLGLYDWAYPHLVVLRLEGETRWSFARLMPKEKNVEDQDS